MESMENMEVLPLERSRVENIKEALPNELSDPLEGLANQLEQIGVELEPVLEAAAEFGEEVLNEGLDVARDFVEDIGQFAKESGILEKVGEFAPALQRAFEGFGRAVVGGLEQVEAADVAILGGIIAIAVISPEMLARNSELFAGQVTEIAGRVIEGAKAAGAAT